MNIIERVKKLNFPTGQYVVVGSGTLDALGIRPARDMDIAVLPALATHLREVGGRTEELRYGKLFLKRDDIDIITQLSWDKYSSTTAEVIQSALVIDEIPFMNLDELRKFKTALGRPKDASDMLLIDTYQKQHES